MKKKLRILVILIAVLLVGTVGYYFMPKKFGKNVNPSEVDHINVFDGNTGTGFTITDSEDIEYIVANIQGISMKRDGISLGRTGYSFKISYINSNDKDILNCLQEHPADFNNLLEMMNDKGYEIKHGKHTAIRGKEQKRFIRFRSLGEEFSEENLKKVIAGEMTPPVKKEKSNMPEQTKIEKRKFDLVVDIQEKMAQGKNGGYVRWAKKYNVKQFAESILFLQQHDIHDKKTLDALVDGSTDRYHELMKIIKDAEEKMAANKVIKTHIINYSKTRDTYIAYRKSGYSKKFYEAHRDEIALHKAAKEAFSKLSDGKIPKVKDLNEEFARLLSEKKNAYSEYKKIKKEMRDYQIAKQNVESFYAAQQSWNQEENLKKKRQQQR